MRIFAPQFLQTIEKVFWAMSSSMVSPQSNPQSHFTVSRISSMFIALLRASVMVGAFIVHPGEGFSRARYALEGASI
jgi:hypothetical protein